MAGVEVVKYTPGRTLQVKVTSPTRVNGKHYDAGQVLELPEQMGLELMGAQKAVRYIEPKK